MAVWPEGVFVKRASTFLATSSGDPELMSKCFWRVKKAERSWGERARIRAPGLAALARTLDVMYGIKARHADSLSS
jgi:hypothetical protein